MTEADYKKDLAKVINIGRAVEEINCEGMLKAICESESVAHIIDPTLYRKAMDNLHAIKRLVQALIPVKERAMELRATVRGDMEINGNS